MSTSCLAILALLAMTNFCAIPGETRKLTNRHVVISGTRRPLIQNRDLAIVSVGVTEGIIFSMLAEHLEFTYDVRPPNDVLSLGNILPNGTWTGITGQLQRNEVDLCVTTGAPTISRQAVVDFSYPVIYVDAAIIVPFPREESKIWLETVGFQRTVWITLGLFVLAMVITIWIFDRITTSDKRNRPSFGYWVVFLVSVLASQGTTVRNPSVTIRIVFVVLFFGIYVISNYFTAFYTSFLSIPILRNEVNSVDDLANSDSAKTLLVRGSSTDDYIMSSTDGNFQKIGNQMRRYPERRITNAFQVDDISSIVNDNYALVIIKSNGESMVERSYRIHRKCHVTMAEKTFFSRPQSFFYQKNSQIASVMDYSLLLLHQAGMIQYAERRAAANWNRCSVTEIKRVSAARAIPLKFADLIGVFIFLVAGMGLGTLVLFSQLLFELCNKKVVNVL